MISTRRAVIGSRWRKLPAHRQALLVLAHLRNGDTLIRLAAGFGIGLSTAWRYLREGIDLLAATAPALAQIMARVAMLAYAVLHGTLIAIDRVAVDRPSTPVSTSDTASTCRFWPMRPAASCGPHPPCPAPRTT